MDVAEANAVPEPLQKIVGVAERWRYKHAAVADQADFKTTIQAEKKIVGVLPEGHQVRKKKDVTLTINSRDLHGWATKRKMLPAGNAEARASVNAEIRRNAV